MTFLRSFNLVLVLILVAICTSVSGQESELIKVVDLADVLKSKAAFAEENRKSNSKPMLFAVQLDPKLGPEDRIIWHGYGVLRQGYRNENSVPRQVKSGEVIPGFLEEVAARKGIVDSSREYVVGFPEPLKSYVADLGKAVEAGFIKEYVWKYHHRKDWTKPAGLKDEQFAEWAKSNLPDGHQALTRAKMLLKPAPKATRTRIFLDKNAIKTAADGAIWMRYGLVRFDYLRKHPETFNAYIQDVVWPGMEEEVYARTVLCKEYEKLTQGDVSDNLRDYLTSLKKVHDNGFMVEYVWTNHSRPEWKQPKELRLEEFNEWSKKHIPDHKPIQGAALIGA